MTDVSIDNCALDVSQDCSLCNDLSIWDIVLNLAVETRMRPSTVLKSVAFSALQWIQISSSYHQKMRADWTKYPDELKNLKAGYEKINYDFLETRFNLNQVEVIEELFFSISSRDDEKDCFSELEINLLKSISVYREHFKDCLQRKRINLPVFWFPDKPPEIKQQVVIDDKVEKLKKSDEVDLDKFSCGSKAIHKVVDRAFYHIYSPNKKPTPVDVFDEIYTEYLYGKTRGTQKVIDEKSIIIDCQERFIKGTVIKWKTNDKNESPLSGTRFSALVKKLNDNQNPT